MVTVIDWVVAPLLHKYELPGAAVSTTLPPSQNESGPAAVTVAGGTGLTVTTWAAGVEVQPPPWLTVTEYEPEVVTVIDCVVAPVLHI